MNKKLFVGRLPFAFSNDQLRALFITSGTVVSAVMVPDAKSGKTRGFGFVDMSTDAEAQTAIQSLNGTPLEEKKIWVTLAREKGDAKPAAPAPFPKSNRRPFGDRPSFGGGRPAAGRRPFGDGPERRPFSDRSPSRPSTDRPGRHFTDGPGGAPSGDRKPPFRGKRSFPGNDARAGGPSKEFRARDSFRGPPKKAGGRRPPPRG